MGGVPCSMNVRPAGGLYYRSEVFRLWQSRRAGERVKCDSRGVWLRFQPLCTRYAPKTTPVDFSRGAEALDCLKQLRRGRIRAGIRGEAANRKRGCGSKQGRETLEDGLLAFSWRRQSAYNSVNAISDRSSRPPWQQTTLYALKIA